MKDALVAKLSSQCDELYTEAFKQMQKESLHPLWERGDYDWLAIVGGKQSAYRGLAQYYQSLVCNAGKNVGEEISRLQVRCTIIANYKIVSKIKVTEVNFEHEKLKFETQLAL
jgi:hypothetical protein